MSTGAVGFRNRMSFTISYISSQLAGGSVKAADPSGDAVAPALRDGRFDGFFFASGVWTVEFREDLDARADEALSFDEFAPLGPVVADVSRLRFREEGDGAGSTRSSISVADTERASTVELPRLLLSAFPLPLATPRDEVDVDEDVDVGGGRV